MNQEMLKNWLLKANQRIQENKDYLSELDRAIGDGDHGVNLSRGFQEVANHLEKTEFPDVGALLQKVAMTLIGKVGGASGPLYGTAFLKAAMTLKGKGECSYQELAFAFSEALAGIKVRGKAETGDKTMVDVWEPVITKWNSTADNVNWNELKDLTRSCMEQTKDLEARKGRAAYLGKRSIGTLDPGAVSSWLILDTLFTELSEVSP